MTPDGFALAATIILLFPMFYFLFVSPNFLLVKLSDPVTTWLLRGLFTSYFLMVSIAGTLGTIAFAFAGRPWIAAGICAMTVSAVFAGRWFRRRMDVEFSARDAGDADAVARLRRLHWGGMVYNVVQLAAVLLEFPVVFAKII